MAVISARVRSALSCCSARNISPTWHPIDHFILNLQLSQFSFSGGIAALPALYINAREGTFAKVILCSIARTGTPVAVKILIPGRGTDRAAFMNESEILLRLYTAIGYVRSRRGLGFGISLEDTGASHVAYCYGIGEDPNLSAVHPALPPHPAFLIAVEPLTVTLTQRISSATNGLLPITDVLRVAFEISLGLAFLGKHSVVVRGTSC